MIEYMILMNGGEMMDKMVYEVPELEVIDVEEMEEITALAGSCACHCNGRA